MRTIAQTPRSATPATSDAIGVFVADMIEASHPTLAWPKGSSGLADFLHATPSPAGQNPGQRLQYLSGLISDGIRRSSICVHANEHAWLESLLKTVCPFDALRSARAVCRTTAMRDRLVQLVEEGRAKEFQDPTREPEPAVLLVDELQGQQFQEVFLASDMDPRTTPRGEILRAVSAARLGLHLIRLAD
jgi:hypothetical protein